MEELTVTTALERADEHAARINAVKLFEPDDEDEEPDDEKDDEDD